MTASDELVRTVLADYPHTQAIYLFGSYGTDDEWPSSDVDVALLLPPAQAKQVGSLMMSPLRVALESLLRRKVDLINLRRVSTVLQKEIIFADRRVFCADRYASDEFEMLVLSYYQKLNQERQGILDKFEKTRRAYPV